MMKKRNFSIFFFSPAHFSAIPNKEKIEMSIPKASMANLGIK